MQVWSGVTSWHKAALRDKDEIVISQSDISTLTLTLVDKATNAIVNGKNGFDLVNGGLWDQGATIDTAVNANGHNFELRLTAADNVILGLQSIETHIAIIKGTTAGAPSFAFTHVFYYDVKKTPI